jgi:HEAT repeat protein
MIFLYRLLARLGNYQPLLQALADKRKQKSAAGAFNQLRNTNAFDTLCSMRNSEDEGTRRYVTMAIGRMNDNRRTQILISTLGDPNYFVKREAVYALGKIGDPIALQHLLPFIRKKDNDLRHDAVSALLDIAIATHDPQKLGPIYELTNDSRSSNRAYANTILVLAGDASALPKLADLIAYGPPLDDIGVVSFIGTFIPKLDKCFDIFCQRLLRRSLNHKNVMAVLDILNYISYSRAYPILLAAAADQEEMFNDIQEYAAEILIKKYSQFSSLSKWARREFRNSYDLLMAQRGFRWESGNPDNYNYKKAAIRELGENLPSWYYGEY